MADITKATALIFDSKMQRIMLMKGPRYFAPSVDMQGITFPREILAEALANLINIPKEFQPSWWHMRSEFVRYSSDASVDNQIYFGKLSDKEFVSVNSQHLVIISIATAMSSSRVHPQLSYWVPMAVFLSNLQHNLWPKP